MQRIGFAALFTVIIIDALLAGVRAEDHVPFDRPGLRQDGGCAIPDSRDVR